MKFFYNDRGQRARKESFGPSGSLANTTYYVRDAAGSVMAVYEKQSQEEPKLAEHPVYGLSRLGVFYRGQEFTAYQLTDHLGNVRAVVVQAGGTAVSVTQKTDYYPFGMPMPGRNIDGGYRYAYQGQEKDDETGMEAFQLRLYDNRIGRWISPDPYGEFHSPYLSMGNNWTNKVDPDGGQTCGCKTGVGKFLGKIGSAIGDFFKSNFGKYRALKPGTRHYRKAMSRNMPQGQGRRQNGRRQSNGRDIVSVINFAQMQGLLQQNIDITASLITPPPIEAKTQYLTIGDVTREIKGGRLTIFRVNFFNGGRNAINDRGVRNGTSFLNPLTNGQVQSLVNLANFLIQNPSARVNFSYPSTQNETGPQVEETIMLYNRSFNIITTILINHGVIDPNSRVLRSNGSDFGVTVIHSN